MSSNEQTRPQFSERQVKIAARLLYLGLDPKHGEADEYHELHRNLVQNPQVESLLHLMAEEFNLNILDISPQLMSLVPKPRSLFATKASDYEFVTSSSDKPIFGLILLGISAFLFPQPWMLASDDYEGKKFGWRDIDGYLRQKIEKIQEQKDKFEQSQSKDDDGIREVLFEYQRLKADIGSTRDRSTTRYFISKVIEYLKQEGFVVPVSEDIYHPTKKFKIHTQQLYRDPNFKDLLNIRGDE